MAYNVNQLVTVGQYKTLAERMKSALDTAIAALPIEQFLDQVHTQFIGSFAYNSTTYPGSTNPNLDGKPVFVLAVKGVDHTNNDAVTTSYSFLNMETLVDTYTAKAGDSAKILNISGYEIEFKVNPDASNAIEVTNTGIKVDITGKADKVANATNGNVSSLDANGNLVDSGISKDNIIQISRIALDTEVTEVLTEVFGSQS